MDHVVLSLSPAQLMHETMCILQCCTFLEKRGETMDYNGAMEYVRQNETKQDVPSFITEGLFSFLYCAGFLRVEDEGDRKAWVEDKAREAVEKFENAARLAADTNGEVILMEWAEPFDIDHMIKHVLMRYVHITVERMEEEEDDDDEHKDDFFHKFKPSDN